MASRLTEVDSRTCDRFNQMDSRVDKMDTRVLQMDTRALQMDTRFTKRNRASSLDSWIRTLGPRLTEMLSDMNSQFAEMNKKYVKSDIKMEAIFANKMPWAPDDILEPLFNLDTGAEIQGVHFRADLVCMSYAAMADCLRELELVPKESEEDRLRQLKEAYGAEIRVRSVLRTYDV
ncbi:hypothetical protein E4U59_000107 [Claviceps monticola]|nr:hypothetical protein E4U59_000107 [Claviceps monticola]